MQLVTKIVAAYLVIVGLAVFLNLIATPLYHDGSPGLPHVEDSELVHDRRGAHHPGRRIPAEAQSSTERAKRARARSSTSGAASSSTGASFSPCCTIWGWFWTLNPDSETSDVRPSRRTWSTSRSSIRAIHRAGVHSWTPDVGRRGRFAELGEVDAYRTLEKVSTKSLFHPRAALRPASRPCRGVSNYCKVTHNLSRDGLTGVCT